MSRKTGGMLSDAARSSPATDADVGAHWRTPPDLAEAINVAFELDPWALDLAATRESSLAPEYFGPDHEDPERRDTLGLRLTIGDLYGSGAGRFPGPVWCNPPYSRQGIDRWMQLCAKLGRPDRPVVALVFARTDCAWFHERALPDAEQILLIKGRVSFLHPSDGKPRAPAGAPSMAILWRRPPAAVGAPWVRGLSWR